MVEGWLADVCRCHFSRSDRICAGFHDKGTNMSNTLHLPKQQPQPQAAPAARAWKNLTGKNVTFRLKSGVSLSGIVTEVALSVVALTDARLLERDGLDWLVPKGVVHIDAASISFAIEGAADDAI